MLSYSATAEHVEYLFDNPGLELPPEPEPEPEPEPKIICSYFKYIRLLQDTLNWEKSDGSLIQFLVLV